jgi:hypothetical protein
MNDALAGNLTRAGRGLAFRRMRSTNFTRFQLRAVMLSHHSVDEIITLANRVLTAGMKDTHFMTLPVLTSVNAYSPSPSGRGLG